MLSLSLGVIGFVLCFLYDINSFRWNTKFMKFLFAIGISLIGVGTIFEFYFAWKAKAFRESFDIVLLVLGFICFAFLIYSLFFALPFQETYVEQINKRHVYNQGVYALCRHPGILCFGAMYFFWGLAALPELWILRGILLSLINTGYAWFQDQVTFPKMFCDYDMYQKETPFLLPNKKSIYRALGLD